MKLIEFEELTDKSPKMTKNKYKALPNNFETSDTLLTSHTSLTSDIPLLGYEEESSEMFWSYK